MSGGPNFSKVNYTTDCTIACLFTYCIHKNHKILQSLNLVGFPHYDAIIAKF